MAIDRHDHGQPKPVIVVIVRDCLIQNLSDNAQNIGGITSDESISKCSFRLIRLKFINKPSKYYLLIDETS